MSDVHPTDVQARHVITTTKDAGPSEMAQLAAKAVRSAGVSNLSVSAPMKCATTTDETSMSHDENNLVIVPNERMLSSRHVQERTGLSRTTIWRLEQTNLFPARRTIALRRVGWLASEIDKWMALRQVSKVNAKEEIPEWLHPT